MRKTEVKEVFRAKEKRNGIRKRAEINEIDLVEEILQVTEGRQGNG